MMQTMKIMLKIKLTEIYVNTNTMYKKYKRILIIILIKLYSYFVLGAAQTIICLD